MKKGLTAIAALALMALVATSCSKQKDQNVEETVGVVEGEIVDMPATDSDSNVIAEGEAVAVEEVAPQPEANRAGK